MKTGNLSESKAVHPENCISQESADAMWMEKNKKTELKQAFLAFCRKEECSRSTSEILRKN